MQKKKTNWFKTILLGLVVGLASILMAFANRGIAIEASRSALINK